MNNKKVWFQLSPKVHHYVRLEKTKKHPPPLHIDLLKTPSIIGFRLIKEKEGQNIVNQFIYPNSLKSQKKSTILLQTLSIYYPTLSFEKLGSQYYVREQLTKDYYIRYRVLNDLFYIPPLTYQDKLLDNVSTLVFFLFFEEYLVLYPYKTLVASLDNSACCSIFKYRFKSNEPTSTFIHDDPLGVLYLTEEKEHN